VKGPTTASEKHMRTLIYKRTHEGDPDHRKGVFGNRKCMGTVRGWAYDAVIGVGGIGRKAIRSGIARRITWIGIGPHKTGKDPRRPKVTFDHFRYCGKEGPLLETVAPALASRIYGKNVRVILDGLTPEERLEVENILRNATEAPPSGQLEGASQRESKGTGGPCQSSPWHGKSAGRKADQKNPAEFRKRRF